MRKVFLGMMLLVAACKVGPDYEAPSFDLPSSWTGELPMQTAAPIPLDWWTLFNDPTLSALEEEGMKNNDDIALAAGRVAQARGILRLTEADLYPTLGYQGAATRQSRSSEATFGGLGSIPSKPFNDFSISAVLTYELDLWGRLRRANESARAQLLSEKANADAVRLAVASDIATGYFNLLAIDAQMEVTEQTIASRQASYDYQQKQFNGGVIDALTFRQAEAELAVAQAALPALLQSRVQQENALAVLLGRSPNDILEKRIAGTQPLNTLPVPPIMPADAPSTLLTRRPDITVAEQQLIAATAQIGVARADYFPTLSLSALLGLNSANIDRTLRSSARTWNIGASTAGPILDWGRVSGNVDATIGAKDQALATYQQTVRRAFGETINAMNAVQTSNSRVAALSKQVIARDASLRVASQRYDAGYSDHLELLDAQRFLYQAQLDSITAMRDRLSATVTLYKALGGGWGDQPATVAGAPTLAAEQAPATAVAPANETAQPAPASEATPAPQNTMPSMSAVLEPTAAPALPAELPFQTQSAN